jgi:DNA-binding transcriptional regulator/RsmH inhibitor MraZ
VAETGDNSTITAVDPPQSVLQASVDDKGRLKVPERFQLYLKAAGVTKLFITTLDMRLGRIYPMSLWNDNLKILANAREHAAAAERMAFLAKVHGSEDEIDTGGRLLLPAKLREVLELEQRQPVWLDVYNGRINITTKRVYDERMAAAKTHMSDDLKALEGLGLI